MWTLNILHDYMEAFYGIGIVFCLSYMGNSFKRLFCHFFLLIVFKYNIKSFKIMYPSYQALKV